MTPSRRTLAILMLAAAACRGYSAPPATPAPQAAEAAVEQFLAAVAAGDLDRMGELWGTARGPSTRYMRQAERERRLTIMHRILQHDQFRIVGTEVGLTGSGRQRFSVELVRGERRALVPFTVVATRAGGWLVTEIGLDAALSPGSPRTSP